MTGNAAKKHHYVPQFYLRRFACRDDPNKVRVFEQHGDVLVAGRKSISRIGYEEGLHDYTDEGRDASFEGALNRVIETPFSQSPTWSKIVAGEAGRLDESDKLAIYGFTRHLQRRNLETLRFIEDENARFRAGELDADLSPEEREMHEGIAAAPGGAHALFREGAMDTLAPADAAEINVMVCRSPIRLRTSTNPAVRMSHPGRESALGPFFNPLRTWFLTLDPQWGAFIIAGGPANFTISDMPQDTARVVNRFYLVQHQNSPWVRYMLADDPFIDADLDWAGYRMERQTAQGARYHKV